MNCPTCRARVLALFHSEDGIHRCWPCKVAADAKPQGPSFATTPGPKDGATYQSPYTRKPTNYPGKRGRAMVLVQMEAEIAAKVADIKGGNPNWQCDTVSLAVINAYTQCVQICRDYQYLDKAGQPVRGGKVP